MAVSVQVDRLARRPGAVTRQSETRAVAGREIIHVIVQGESSSPIQAGFKFKSSWIRVNATGLGRRERIENLKFEMRLAGLQRRGRRAAAAGASSGRGRRNGRPVAQ